MLLNANVHKRRATVAPNKSGSWTSNLLQVTLLVPRILRFSRESVHPCVTELDKIWKTVLVYWGGNNTKAIYRHSQYPELGSKRRHPEYQSKALLLKPTCSAVLNHITPRFNTQKFYVLSTRCINVFHADIRINTPLTCFCNRDGSVYCAVRPGYLRISNPP